jgi:SAM-dependent methyltransferase
VAVVIAGRFRSNSSLGISGKAPSDAARPSLLEDGWGLCKSVIVIDPKQVIRRYTPEELAETADQYYRRIDDPTPLMTKPFSFLHEAPEMLQNLGLLLSGLHLGKTMSVLDFGGGTGWLSRFLSQLNCQVICCDVSKAALAIGGRLMNDWPLLGTAVYRPVFLPFDGHRIALADGSVERIICFDAFHHVPNQREILSEFGRVLKDGGIAGFSEPGRRHSQSPQSQYEMANHRVLENDIDLVEIFDAAKAHGFTSLSVKVLTDLEIGLDDYRRIFDDRNKEPLKSEVWNQTHNTMFNRSVFFLHKGARRRDSPNHAGLSHALQIGATSYAVNAREPLRVTVRATNTGDALWLHENSEIFGIVRLGSHLYDAAGTLISIDFTRHALAASVKPGDVIDIPAAVTLPGPGAFRIAFDLVAEGVTWFETRGAHPLVIDVTVAAEGR